MLKLHCDNPACETEVEWESTDRLPFDWWEVSKVVPDESRPANYAVCSAACVRGLHEQLLAEDVEKVTREPVGDL